MEKNYLDNEITNRVTGFRAPSTFHEKVRVFCEANDITPSQLYRRATLTFIESVERAETRKNKSASRDFNQLTNQPFQ